VLRAQESPAQSQNLPKTSPQTEQTLPSYEGQRVTSVDLAGHPYLDKSTLEPLLAQHANEPFSQAKVQQSIEALENTRMFKAVDLEIRPEPNGVRLIFVLEPAIYYGIYEFPGSLRAFNYSRLLQVTNYPPRGAYTDQDVTSARDALETFLRRSGYFQAKVETSLEIHPLPKGLVDIIFYTTLNRRAEFGKVIIEGTSPQKAAELERDLRTIRARLRGNSIITGKSYSLSRVRSAAQYLNDRLSKQGYLAAKVSVVGAAYDPSTNRADVTFSVQAGPHFHVKVQGAHIWSWDKSKLLPIYEQAGVNPEIIQEGRQNLLSYFQSKGYFDAEVTATTAPEPQGETIVYRITKGPRYKVSGVRITGNKHIPDSVLMPLVKVNKARFVTHGKYSNELVRTSINNLTAQYEAEGFSSVDVTSQVTKHDHDVDVTFHVKEGPQNVVASLKVEGNETQSIQSLVPKGLKLTPGKPYSQRRVEEDRRQIMASYLNLGYLNATFRETVQEVGKNTHRIEVVYHITEGPEVRIAHIYTLGRRQTRQTLVNRAVKMKPEQPMREDQMLTAENRLYDLGIFDWAEVDPRRPITTQTQEDTVVKLHESKRNVMTYGFGFEVINRGGNIPSGTVVVPGLPAFGVPSTFTTAQKRFWGPRGTFEYTRKNILGEAESFSAVGLAARLIQRGSLIYTDPYFRSTDWSSTVGFSYEHNAENPIYTSLQLQSWIQFEHPLNTARTTNIFLRYQFSKTDLTQILIPDLVPPSDQHVRLSTISGTYIRDTRDNALNAHKGIYESFQVDVNPSFLGSNANFARSLSQAAYYKTIPRKIVWANSLRLGFEVPFANSFVPLSEEFFSGGPNSLRGFPLNGAGPQRTLFACGTPGVLSTCTNITVPVGGRQLVILNSEFRIPVPVKFPLIGRKLEVVPFYDGGNVFSAIGFHGRYTNTVGGGVRYLSPVGPIRLDVGHLITNIPGIGSTQIWVTLGQAF
jgi:outer membrane protein insertion porin family